MSSSNQSPTTRFFLHLWYGQHPLAWVFLPLSWLFWLLSQFRRIFTQLSQAALPIPVVVVGNITVGGTGKTPVVITLVRRLQEEGFKVGVISRGYGRSDAENCQFIAPNSSVSISGDEALLIAQETGCPVMVGSNRLLAAQKLIKQIPDLDVIISDDGLQHYRLPRDFEIVVVDGSRGLGNGYCLPAGPLRETPSRLKKVDWVLLNGADNSEIRGFNNKSVRFELKPSGWQHLTSQQRHPLNPFPWVMDRHIAAIAAIGNPQRFFNTLTNLGIEFEPRSFDDHYSYKVEDFQRLRNKVLLMTTKDAVKCKQFANNHWWALYVDAVLPDELVADVIQLARKKL